MKEDKMRKDLWRQRLDEIKKHETPETVLAVAGGAKLTKAVVA